MPVNQDQFQVTPYTSTVPLLQIPPDAISGQTRPAQPLQGEFGRKGTGALAIGDSLLKGFMLGHEQKEQRKQAQAQATINAADAAANAAYDQYQTALTNAGGKADDPKAQAAYQEYIKAFQAGKQAKAQFVIPEKTQKGKKAAADTDPVKSPDDKKKKNPVSAGFNNIKDFFEANPHIVPQIALLTMQPKPQGLSAEGQQQVQNLESQKLANQETQQKQQDLQTYSAGRAIYDQLTPDQIQEGMKDPKWATAYQAYDAAKARLTPMRDESKDRVWTNGTDFISLPIGQAPPPGAGYKPYEKTPTNESQTNMYYDAAARAWGTTRDKLTVQQLEYVDAMRARTKAQSSGQTTYSYSTVDPQGNRSTVTRKISEPVPKPAGVTDLPASVFQQGIQPPPGGSQASPAASGGLRPPPTARAAATGQGSPLAAGTGKPGSPLNPYPNPEDQPGETSFAFNKPWAKPGPYLTKLSPEDEAKFQKWMKDNPGVVDQNDLDDPQSGYDVRGWWQAGEKGDPSAKRVRNAWDGKMHSSDKWKTPYNGTFSNESLYATPGAPRWKGDKLVTADGRIVADETPKPKSASKGGISRPPQASQSRGITPPPGKKETALTASVTRQAVTKQQEGYRKAETAYTKALADADKAFAAAQKTAASTGDQSILQTAQAAKDRAYARAKLDLLDAKDSVAKEYDTAVKSIGGTPGGQDNTADNPPPGASARVKDANGKLIGWAVNGQFVPLGQ